MTLEELMGLEVTTPARKGESLSETAAAVHVVTQDDIRRMGITSIPEALRTVPGVEVARIDASKWAITARGFNGRFANKLLVLLDGRSVYTPVYSGVFWEEHDVVMEDIERIEVVRGPGATLWGANAVNGVINVITKNAKHTQGGLLAWGVGTEERSLGSLRYGGRLGEKAFYRVFGKSVTRDAFVLASGEGAEDGWDAVRGGFRIDWQASEADAVSIQGEAFDGHYGNVAEVASTDSPFVQVLPADADMHGGDVMGRWERRFSTTSDMALQAYYDRAGGSSRLLGGRVQTFDLDFQHRFGVGRRQEVLWGAGYRFTTDGFAGNRVISLHPTNRRSHILSAFLQNTVRLARDQLSLSVGSKFERNSFSGLEVQPGARLLWMPARRHTFWSAVFRAVRTPSRADDDMRIVADVVWPVQTDVGAPPVFLMIVGDRGFRPEEVLAFEAGYRVRPAGRIFLDVATYSNFYDHLRSLELGNAVVDSVLAPGRITVPIFWRNGMGGRTRGVELAGDWQPLDRWRVHAAYTYAHLQLHLRTQGVDPVSEGAEGQTPAHQVSVRSSVDLPGHLELDLRTRYVSELPNLKIGSRMLHDLRLGWQPMPSVEVSVAAHGLFKGAHLEFVSELPFYLPTRVERAIHASVAWRF